jgi:ketosteroid isomerase-like protein
MKTIYLITGAFFVIFFSSCSNCDKKVDLAAETIAIEHLLENYIIANETQDFDLIEAIWSPQSDIILYGTDSHERLMGWTNIRKAVKSQFSQIEDTYIAASDQFIKVNDDGTTAWFAENLNYNFMYKGVAQKYEGLRFTGVLSKGDDGWKIVQAHLSVPASVGVGK